jgi:hypothetical protein
VRYPLAYTIEELTGIRSHVDNYISAYEFVYAQRFLNRYDFWRRRENRGRAPCAEDASEGRLVAPMAAAD